MVRALESEEPDSEYGIGLLLFCGAVSRTGKAREFVLFHEQGKARRVIRFSERLRAFPVDGPAKRLGFAGSRVLKAC